MTLEQMRYVLEQVSHFRREDLQVCLYLANGACLIGEAGLVEPHHDNNGAGIVQIEGGSGGIAYIDATAVAAVRIVFPEDEPEATDGPITKLELTEEGCAAANRARSDH